MGFKILNFNIFGVFRKNEYFWRHEDFLDIFVGHYQIGLFLGVISLHYRVFLKVKAQNGGGGGIFLVAKISNSFGWGGGCLKFLILFWG